MNTTTETPANVLTVQSMLQRGRWDTIETEDRSGFWIVRATRYAGTLAETSCTGYVSTRLSKRGRFLGGYHSSIGDHRKLRTWQDFRIWSDI